MVEVVAGPLLQRIGQRNPQLLERLAQDEVMVGGAFASDRPRFDESVQELLRLPLEMLVDRSPMRHALPAAGCAASPP